MDIALIDDMLASDLEAMEREMARILGDKHPFLNALAGRIMDTPGKRLRPKLLMLCAGMLDYRGSEIPQFALVFELVHTATLIHDDIIDNAATRRGRTTLNHDLDNTLTVLYGDLLYTKAHATAVKAGRLDLADLVDWVSERMIEGELIQNRLNFDLDITEADYFDILTRKTAYLFAGTAKAAGMMAQSGEADCQRLFDYGFNFGVSFQLLDDYLNYTGKEQEMGKPVLSDLVEGKITLPVIKLLSEGEERVRECIKALWEDEDRERSSWLAARIRNHPGLSETLDSARSYADRAVTSLDGFPDNAYSRILRGLPRHLLNRKK